MVCKIPIRQLSLCNSNWILSMISTFNDYLETPNVAPQPPVPEPPLSDSGKAAIGRGSAWRRWFGLPQIPKELARQYAIVVISSAVADGNLNLVQFVAEFGMDSPRFSIGKNVARRRGRSLLPQIYNIASVPFLPRATFTRTVATMEVENEINVTIEKLTVISVHYVNAALQSREFKVQHLFFI